MGWEEIRTSVSVCPCGKGKITQKHFGDDWNRYQDGPVIIECETCSKKYKVEEIIHQGLITTDGSWSTYFLVPANYPEYKGISESKEYPQLVNQYDDFSAWLIENYTEDVLHNVLVQLQTTNSSKMLQGTAAKIRESHRKALGTVRISEMTITVEEALKRYSSYNGTKEQRDIVRKQEAFGLSEYMKEKQKHIIKIDFTNCADK